ncbi:flagellar assembly protein A [Sulfurimonas sp.]|uniref:flagellar assembly protein A n=1 Tax=Sulfurimonas sp. TaxID=2022749 RepID=UPI002AB04F4F|nr:flagellar assembly protein A [Sulfurimonas sp.]
MREIQSTTVKTKNVKKSIARFASQNEISIDICDFTIRKTATYMKTSLDDDFKLFNENVAEHYKDKNELVNQHVEFHQLYILTLAKAKEPSIKLSYILELGKHKCMPILILKPDSIIPYKKLKPKETYALLVKEFNKIKVRNTILINLFDESMLNKLKAFTKHLYSGKFKKNIKFSLFEGIEPKITRAGKLILWFKNKENDDKHQIIEVEKDEVLVEYKKPIYGKSGFSAEGKHLGASYSTNADDLRTPIDAATIYIEENDDKKLYKSKVKGFVKFTTRLLAIDNKVKISKISRVEDSIAKEEDNNIEVHISQNDTTKDSIGEGVELVSETIHVNGHIGANSILEAVNLRIDGATHKNSIQFAKTAKINRHKGTLRCKEAKISLLEGGTVHATTIEVEASLGGTIYAQNVTIGHVKSNLKVYASESITINLVSGEDNLFKINYKDIPILNSKVDLINEDIINLKDDLEEAQRHNQSKIPEIEKNILNFKNELQYIQESTLRAKISIEKPFIGLNRIVFTLYNEDEIMYKTQAQSYKPFYLKVSEDKITLEPVKKSISLN